MSDSGWWPKVSRRTRWCISDLILPNLAVAELCVAVAFGACLLENIWWCAVQMIQWAKGTIQSLMEQFVLAALPSATSSLVCRQEWSFMKAYESIWKQVKAYESLQFRFQHGRTQADSGNITVWHRCLQLYSFDHGEDTWSFMEIQEATNCSRVR